MKEPTRYSWPFQDITKKQRKKSDVSNPFQVNALFLHPLKAKIKITRTHGNNKYSKQRKHKL